MRKTANHIYVQFVKFPDSFVKFVKSKLSEPESVELIHEGGTVCRFRVYNDSDLDVLKKLTSKYLDIPICLCSKNLDHVHWKEWNENFKKCKNIRIIPNEKQYKGPERMFVHYPLVRFIGKGKLSEHRLKELKKFKKDSTLILCNLMIPLSDAYSNSCDWVDKRPDIICLTKMGDVLVIQCKPKEGIAKTDGIEDDIKGFLTTKFLATNHPIKRKIERKKEILSSDLAKLENLYDARYPRHLKFPYFRTTLNELFSIKTDRDVSLWSEKVMNSIRNDKLIFGFAFDGDMNEETAYSLKNFHANFLSKMGRNNKLFYFAVNGDKSVDVFEGSKLFETI
jgi:hypothetical protein